MASGTEIVRPVAVINARLMPRFPVAVPAMGFRDLRDLRRRPGLSPPAGGDPAPVQHGKDGHLGRARPVELDIYRSRRRHARLEHAADTAQPRLDRPGARRSIDPLSLDHKVADLVSEARPEGSSQLTNAAKCDHVGQVVDTQLGRRPPLGWHDMYADDALALEQPRCEPGDASILTVGGVR